MVSNILSHIYHPVKELKNMQRFGVKLRTIRKERGLSQHQLAEQLRFSRSFINELESNRKRPNTLHVLKIADFFGITTDVLIRDELDLDMDNEPS